MNKRESIINLLVKEIAWLKPTIINRFHWRPIRTKKNSSEISHIRVNEIHLYGGFKRQVNSWILKQCRINFYLRWVVKKTWLQVTHTYRMGRKDKHPIKCDFYSTEFVCTDADDINLILKQFKPIFLKLVLFSCSCSSDYKK